MKPAAIIYLVTNLINGKRYVGLTRFNLKKRWREHRYHAKTGLRSYFYSAMRKCGVENFSVTPIASCLSVFVASEVEREVIKTHKPEYNRTNGGEFTVGKRVPREVVERIIAKNTGLKRTPKMNAANSAQAKARHAYDSVYRQKILASLEKARANCDQEKRKTAVGKSAHERVWSVESRAKLSNSRKGIRHTQVVLDQIAEKHKKPVECITLGVTFDSILEASAHLRISNSAIGRACAGIRQKTAGGMQFQLV
jgi:group I intron endonuclease